MQPNTTLPRSPTLIDVAAVQRSPSHSPSPSPPSPVNLPPAPASLPHAPAKLSPAPTPPSPPTTLSVSLEPEKPPESVQAFKDFDLTKILSPSTVQCAHALARHALPTFLITWVCGSGVFIPLGDVSKGSIAQNSGFLGFIFLTCFGVWIPRIVWASDAIGPPPIPQKLSSLADHFQMPKCILYLYRFWLLPFLNLIVVVVVVIIPCWANAFPVTFLCMIAIIALGGSMSSLFMKFLYPKSVRTAENTKVLSSIGKMIFVLGAYTFTGFLFLIGFYRSSAFVQLVLVCVLNGITFILRFMLRRLLTGFGLPKYEGPTMFFLLSISQILSVASLPKANQYYVYVGSFILKIISGLWPLLSKFKFFLFFHRFARVGVYSEDPEIQKEKNPILFWDADKEAINSFATMYSTVTSSIVFMPILMFLRYGYSNQYFIYSHLTSYELGMACVYIVGSSLVSIITFVISNFYFQSAYKVDSFQLGVQDFTRYFPIYVSTSIYVMSMFVVATVRHADVLYFAAKPLYGDV